MFFTSLLHHSTQYLFSFKGDSYNMCEIHSMLFLCFLACFRCPRKAMSYSLLTARAATILMVRILVLIVIIAGFVVLICYAAPPEANASLRNSVQTLLEAGKTVLTKHQRRGGTVSVEFGSSAIAPAPNAERLRAG